MNFIFLYSTAEGIQNYFIHSEYIQLPMIWVMFLILLKNIYTDYRVSFGGMMILYVSLVSDQVYHHVGLDF